jgi:hypothetical protein
MSAEIPTLSSDFAERVLKRVARVRRRRALTWAGVALVAVAAVGVAIGRRAPAAPTAAELVAADFEWLEEVGTGTSTPASIVFPDEQNPDENLLVAVARSQ